MYVVPMQIGDILELDMQSLAYGGKGVGPYDNHGVPFSIFVSMTVPGDKVKVKINSVRHRFAEATLLEILTPSPLRIKPLCPYFGMCGGCDWQHVSYGLQLEEKQKQVAAIFKHYQLANVLKIIPSKQFGYRDRARFHKNNSALGLMQRSSNKILDIKKCIVSSEVINEQLRVLRLGCDISGSLDLATSSVIPLPEFGLMLHFYEPCFTQQSFTQNQILVKTVLQFLDLKITDVVLDLFSGIGNFSLPAARFVKAVIGVEGVKVAVKAAIENAVSHQIRNVSFKTAGVLQWLKSSKVGADKIIIDPPRDGLGDAARFLNGVCAKKIVYVSCDLRSLSRDLRLLKNYDVVRVQPIDMSPQTYHVETVVELIRK
ncbi:MAG: methyltransferase domain-containing protein [Nanoarchaeota archaeon]